jgi:hypothetical protein
MGAVFVPSIRWACASPQAETLRHLASPRGALAAPMEIAMPAPLPSSPEQHTDTHAVLPLTAR